MFKVVEITIGCCEECPHFISDDLSDRCLKAVRLIKDEDTCPPSWCPLPNSKEKEAKND